MYSRNFGISVPKNYSGNRFSNQSEPSTKTHRADKPRASKHSHSPSFVTRSSSNVDSSIIAPLEDENEVYEAEAEQIIQEENFVDISENTVEQVEAEGNQSNIEEEKPKQALLDLSGIHSFLSGIDRDELIILGLIFLFISDSAQKNTDIIALLALLLLG